MNKKEDIQSLATRIVSNQGNQQETLELFNTAIKKKNAVRVSTYDELLDDILAEMKERLATKSGQFNNADLLNYLKVIQEAQNNSTKMLNNEDDGIPTIKLNQQNININVEDSLSRDSRARVMDFVNKIMQSSKSDIIEVEEDDSNDN